MVDMMENLIFEILKMAGFIVVLFLCCLWLVKDKRSFYKFRDWGLIPLTALAGFVIYCIGYWEAGTKESLITLVVRSFLSTFHMFFLHSDLLEVRHHMHTNATYMFAFYSLCGISGQLSGRFAIVRQTIPVLAEIKTLYPERQLYLFRFERRSCSFGGRFTEKRQEAFYSFYR